MVLLSPCELDTTMKMILQMPMWAQRVIYIQGSALKDTDLTRARYVDINLVLINLNFGFLFNTFVFGPQNPNRSFALQLIYFGIVH